MIKQELKVSSKVLTPAPDREPTRARCYVVPAASVEADDSGILHRIWELASSTGAEVRFVGLCAEKSQEPAMRRSLVTKVALMRSGGLTVHVEIITGRSWIHRLQASLGPEDTVICRMDPSERFLGRPLSWQLQAELVAPFYILSGSEAPQTEQPHWLAEAAAWIGSVAILAGFFLLQVKIHQTGGGWTIFIESLSVVAEVVLILAWNAWLSDTYTQSSK
jgi:hypothetical protein